MSIAPVFLTRRLLARVPGGNVARSPMISRLMSTSLDERFKVSQDRAGEVMPDANNNEKLKIYSLFKQATIGQNTTKKPHAMNFEGSMKWKAWSKLGDLPQEDAKQQYVDYVNELLTKAGKEPVA